MDLLEMWPWALATVAGFIVLGIVIGFGMARTSHRSQVEREVRDEGTRKVYRDSETEP